MEKYKITEETKSYLGITLHRIQALKDFGNVKTGDLGGWVQSEDNLSQKGDCWVYGNAIVSDNAWVYGNAEVSGNAHICGNAEVYEDTWVYGNALVSDNAQVFGNAQVYGDSQVFGDSQVYEDTWVYGDSRVYGNALVYGNAQVNGNAEVFGNSCIYDNAWVCGNAEVSGNAEVFGNALVFNNALLKDKKDFICILPIGSRNDSITFYKTKDGICVVTGSFNGSIDSFEQAVQKIYGDNEYAEQYKFLIELAKRRIK